MITRKKSMRELVEEEYEAKRIVDGLRAAEDNARALGLYGRIEAIRFERRIAEDEWFAAHRKLSRTKPKTAYGYKRPWWMNVPLDQRPPMENRGTPYHERSEDVA
jgi:hypothetical protein